MGCGFWLSARNVVLLILPFISGAEELNNHSDMNLFTSLFQEGNHLPETVTQLALAGRLAAFSQWLKKHDGDDSQTKAVLSHNARIHTQAALHIRAGEPIVHIPAFLTINSDDVRGTAYGKAASALWAAEHLTQAEEEAALLAVWLSREAGLFRSSVYQPFFDLLPSSVLHLPAAYSPRQLQLLRLSLGIADKLKSHFNQANRIAKCVSRFIASLDGGGRSKRFSGVKVPALAAWAVLTVQSFALAYPRSISGDGEVLTIVPGVSLINHAHHTVANQPSARFDRSASGTGIVSSFTLRAGRALHPGDDIFTSYFPPGHNYCQLDILMQYGFTEAGDLADCSLLQLDISDSVFSPEVRKSVSALRRAKLVESGMLHPDEDTQATMLVTLRFNHSLPSRAVRYLRLANLDAADVRADKHRAKLADSLAQLKNSEHQAASTRVGGVAVYPAFVLETRTNGGPARETGGSVDPPCSTTTCAFTERQLQISPHHTRARLAQNITRTAILLQQMRNASNANGAGTGGLGTGDTNKDSLPVASRDLDLTAEGLHFASSEISGRGMISYQNEIRTMRLFLRLLADTEAALLKKLQQLAADNLISADRRSWSLTERNIMRVHEGSIRTLRWHAAETERAWVRLLYQPDMFWESGRMPSLHSDAPWRGGLLEGDPSDPALTQ